MIISQAQLNQLINQCVSGKIRGLTIIGKIINPILSNESQLNSTLFNQTKGQSGVLASTNAAWEKYPINIAQCNGYVAVGIWQGFITQGTMSWLIQQFSDIVGIYQVPKITDTLLNILINNPSQFDIVEMVSMIKDAQYYIDAFGKVISNPTQLLMSSTCGLPPSTFTDFKSGRKKVDIDSIGYMQKTWRYLPWEQLIAHISII